MIIATDCSNPASRVLVLKTRVRRMRVEIELAGRADTIHYLRNTVLTVQGAITLAEARLERGDSSKEVDSLLELGEARLHAAQALIARARVRRAGTRAPRLAAA